MGAPHPAGRKMQGALRAAGDKIAGATGPADRKRRREHFRESAL